MTARRLLLALAAAAVPAAGRAQLPQMPDPGPPPAISYEGTEVFRYLLQRAGLKAWRDDELGVLMHGGNYSDTVLVVLGQATQVWVGGFQPRDWMEKALQGGGGVLLATRTKTQFGPAIGTQGEITGDLVGCDRGTPRFGGRPDSPLVVPAPVRGRNPVWGLFGGDRPLTRVATQSPSVVSLPTLPGHIGRLSVVAELPAGCVLQTFRGREPIAGEPVAVAAAGAHPHGRAVYRYLAVADPAVFCNGLLVGGDENGPTDNLELADRAVRFLSEIEGTDRKRTRCLFVENGRVVSNLDELGQKFRPPLPPIPIPPWDQLQPKIVDLGNKVIDQIQQKDLPNKLVVGPDPEHPQSRLRYLLAGLLVMASLWAGFALIRRVWGARQPGDIPIPPPDGRPPAPADGTPPGVFGRRGRELAARDNVLEPARAACRALFDDAAAPDGTGPKLPPVVISDVVTKPGTLAKALADLWAVAYGRPVPLQAARWATLEPLLARARAAFAAGKWRFVDRPRGVA